MNKEQIQVIVLVTMTCSPYINYTIPFVGNDYYCESGRGIGERGWVLYYNDPSGMVKIVLDMRLLVALLQRCQGLLRN